MPTKSTAELDDPKAVALEKFLEIFIPFDKDEQDFAVGAFFLGYHAALDTTFLDRAKQVIANAKTQEQAATALFDIVLDTTEDSLPTIA